MNFQDTAMKASCKNSDFSTYYPAAPCACHTCMCCSSPVCSGAAQHERAVEELMQVLVVTRNDCLVRFVCEEE